MQKPTTIYDIAKRMNISAATVSRVLSNSKYPVRAELAKRIRETAREMNYHPNSIGRQLKTNKTSTIGVIIPSITNPFYSAVVSGIEEVASEKGYHVLLCNSQQSPELEMSHLTTLFEKQVKGVILSSVSDGNEELKSYMKSGLKVVSIDQTIDDFSAFQINFDYRKGGRIGTRYLIDQGHRDIAYLTAPLSLPSRKQIYQGFLETMEEHGLPVGEDRLIVSRGKQEDGELASQTIGEFENGKRLAERLLRKKPWPTAIFTCNDMTAFGVLNELMTQGVRSPEDISVIGFDNLDFAGIVSPALTTIEQPKYEMGRMACRMLMEWMDNEVNQPGELILQPRLVERNSVRRL